MTHPDWCDTIGRNYVSGDWGIQSPDKLRRAYGTYVTETTELYRDIPVPVEFQEQDPYDDYQDMKETVEQEGKLRVFTGGDTPAYLTHAQNLQGRAVHDWHGHLGFDVPFTPEGEFLKWWHMSNMYSTNVCQLLFAEVVGQVSAIHHVGGFDYSQTCTLAPTEAIERVCQYYDKPVPEGAYRFT